MSVSYDNVASMMRGMSHYRGRREAHLAWLDDREWMNLPAIVDHGQADAAAAHRATPSGGEVDPVVSDAWRELRRR